MKDADDPLLRQWCLLREIPRQPRWIRTATLKERLEDASFSPKPRTIQRDLAKLSKIFQLKNSKFKGWSWEASAPQQAFPALDPQAALVFYFAEQQLKPLLPTSTLAYLSPWFRTASGTLDSQDNGLSAWRKKVRVLPLGPPMQPPAIDGKVQSVVTQALLLNKRLAVTYRPRGKQEDKNYEASPLGLVVRDQVIYLVCTLYEYQDVKQLVLSRMRSAKLLDTPAKGLDGFDLDQYIAQGEFGMPLEPGRTIKLVADFDRPVARFFIERPLDVNQVVEDINEKTVRLTATVLDTQELRRWLLGFGAGVEVIGPETLRYEFVATVSELAKRYG